MDVDFFSADNTISVFTKFNSTQSALDRCQFLPASTCGLHRHLLSLHRVHPGQPANACLIEFYRP